MLACELSTYPSGRIAHPFSHLKKVGKCGGHYSARQRRISTVGMWVTHLPLLRGGLFEALFAAFLNSSSSSCI